jgi:hypothetical protein
MDKDGIMKQSLLVVLCIALFGCDPRYDATEEKPYEEWSDWSDGQLVSIINDSLVVLKICKYRTETWYEYGFSGQTEHSKIIDSRTGLFLVNYRNKQKPLLGDTLSHDLIIANEYHKDSSVLVFDKKNSKFGFWKVGGKLIEFNNYSISKDCNFSSVVARPWINGNILLKPNSCQLSILNVGIGQIEPFVFSEEYEWLSECYDISYIGSKIACIKVNDSEDHFFELVADAIVTDTLAYEYSRWHRISNWYGNYLKDNRYGTGNSGGIGEISKIDTSSFKFDDAFEPMKCQDNNGYSTFQGSNFVMYYEKDLIKAIK